MRTGRREFIVGAATLAATLPTALWGLRSTVRGVKIGLTTGSLTPLPSIPGRTGLDVLIDQCRRMGAANIELGSRFFGPEVSDVVKGRAPKVPTQAYLDSREVQRRWRLSPASRREFAAVTNRFARAGLNLFSMSNSVFDDCTDAEIDAMFGQMHALGIAQFQTNQTRLPMAPKLIAAAEKYRINPAFHNHAVTDDPGAVVTSADLTRLLALSPLFRVCLDIGHFTASDQDPVAFLRDHHARVTHIHVKDRQRDGGPNVAWGRGDTPIGDCLRLIRDRGWPIVVLVEREYDDGGTPYAQTAADFASIRSILDS